MDRESWVIAVQFVTAAAGFLVAFGAVSAAITIIVKAPFFGRPLRWLWRTNVSHPIGEWNRGIVAGVVDGRVEYLMTHRNGGSSLLDLADSVGRIECRLTTIEGNQNGFAADLAVFRRHNTEMTRAVREDVSTLLEHDDERDKPDKRYGPDMEDS